MTILKTGQLASESFLTNPRNIMEFYLIKQSAGSRNDEGVFVPGSPPPVKKTGSVQPLDGKSRANLPEAERLMDAICVLYLTIDHDAISPLRIGTLQTDSDIIRYRGIKYAVRVVHDMADFGHLEVHATRLEGQSG